MCSRHREERIKPHVYPPLELLEYLRVMHILKLGVERNEGGEIALFDVLPGRDNLHDLRWFVHGCFHMDVEARA